MEISRMRLGYSRRGRRVKAAALRVFALAAAALVAAMAVRSGVVLEYAGNALYRGFMSAHGAGPSGGMLARFLHIPFVDASTGGGAAAGIFTPDVKEFSLDYFTAAREKKIGIPPPPVRVGTLGAAVGPALYPAVPMPEGEYPVKPIDLSWQKEETAQLLMLNQTSFSLDINDFAARQYPITGYDVNSGEPLVLIVCTHATESYRANDAPPWYSPPFTAERTADPESNVLRVAAVLRQTLESYGIAVLQSMNVHDRVSYNASYARSLETINEYLKKYPSIRYVIDVHRDSLIAESGEKYRPAVSVDGKNAAQLMLVVGTSDGGAAHPNWRDNLTFAARWQQAVNEAYPTLMRPVNLRTSRFNQHATKGSVILEVGSCGNSFEEAEYGARLAGECLARVIIENSGG